jgi:hypothetical protein
VAFGTGSAVDPAFGVSAPLPPPLEPLELGRVAALAYGLPVPPAPVTEQPAVVTHWCTGCDGVVAVESMAWTDAGEWLCRDCRKFLGQQSGV